MAFMAMGKIRDTFNLSILAIVLLLASGAELRAQQSNMSMMQYVVEQRPLLSQLITRAGLTPALSGQGPYTLLAPPEQALQQYKNKPMDELREIMAAYVLQGNYSEQDLKDGATLKSMAGTDLTICRKDNYTLVNGVRITSANHALKNGVLHEVANTFSF